MDSSLRFTPLRSVQNDILHFCHFSKGQRLPLWVTLAMTVFNNFSEDSIHSAANSYLLKELLIAIMPSPEDRRMPPPAMHCSPD